MSRPKTKEELLFSANDQFEKMWVLIDSLTEDEQAASFHFGDTDKLKEAHWTRDKNLRDVLVHLFEWHQLLLHWINANQNGEAKPFLPAPYTWKTYGDMNVLFFKKHQETSYDASKTLLRGSHKDVLHLIQSFSNEELFTSKYFPWTGTTSLGSYCVSATSSHYDWAMKKIKLHKKTL